MGIKKPKIGIAISLYDKFEELSLLIDIIKENWKGDYIISVCSNHPNPEKFIKKLNIDIFTKGEDIKFNKGMSQVRRSINMRCRVADCIKKSCLGAINAGADYVMHLHTDAWPLKEEAILNIIKNMQKEKKDFAFRGLGFSKYRHDCPVGHIDDMFFIINSKTAVKKEYFNFNTLAFMPHKLSIHGVLSLIVLGKIGLENTLHYDNFKNNLFWDNKKHPGDIERVRPSIYEPNLGLLHVDTPTFPKDLGKSIQALYLTKNNLINGKNIQKFLSENYIPEKKLKNILKKIEQNLDFKLKIQGFPILKLGRFGRNFNKKEKYLKMPFLNKTKYSLISSIRYLWEEFIAKKLGVHLIPAYSFWPVELEDLFGNYLYKEDFKNQKIFWFPEKRNKKIDKKLPPFYNKFYKYDYKGM